MSPVAIGVSMVAKVADAIGDALGRIGNTDPLSIDPMPQIFRQFSGDRSEQFIDRAVVIVEGSARHAGGMDDVVDLRGQAFFGKGPLRDIVNATSRTADTIGSVKLRDFRQHVPPFSATKSVR